MGKLIDETWRHLPDRFLQIALDEYVIMPNHFHAILFITPPAVAESGQDRAGTSPDPSSTPPVGDRVGATLVVAPPAVAENGQERAGTSPAPTNSTPVLGDIIGAFKSITTHEIILAVRRGEIPPFQGKIWQRNYYEHIIRSENELIRFRRYIIENPERISSAPG
jgi:REP element-mobilizing transposase RayT